MKEKCKLDCIKTEIFYSAINTSAKWKDSQNLEENFSINTSDKGFPLKTVKFSFEKTAPGPPGREGPLRGLIFRDHFTMLSHQGTQRLRPPGTACMSGGSGYCAGWFYQHVEYSSCEIRKVSTPWSPGRSHRCPWENSVWVWRMKQIYNGNLRRLKMPGTWSRCQGTLQALTGASQGRGHVACNQKTEGPQG